MSVLDYLRHRQSKREAENLTAWQRYRRLLQDFVDGQEVDSTEADSILDAANKSEDDLQRDCETLQKRIEWARQLESASDAEHNAAMAELRIQEAQQAINQVVAKHQPIIDSARMVINAASQQQMTAGYARSNLTGSVLDPQLTSRIDELNTELRSLHERRRDAEDSRKALNLAYWQTMVDQAHTNFDKTLDGAGKQHWAKLRREYQSRLDDATSREKRYTSELSRLQSRISEIQSELEDLHDRMLEP